MTQQHTQTGISEGIKATTGIEVSAKEVKPGCWVVAPKDRSLLQSKAWQALRSGPAAGIGRTPIEAAILLALAMGKVGIKPPSQQQAAKAWLQSLLGNGLALMASDIKARAQDAGHTWTAVDRAARESTPRSKLGF